MKNREIKFRAWDIEDNSIMNLSPVNTFFGNIVIGVKKGDTKLVEKLELLKKKKWINVI